MTLFLIIVIAIAAWLWRAIFRPFADCALCGGNGKKRSGKRFRRCWRCRGTGHRQVLGSKQVHKSIAAARGRKWRTK